MVETEAMVGTGVLVVTGATVATAATVAAIEAMVVGTGATAVVNDPTVVADTPQTGVEATPAADIETTGELFQHARE